MSTDPYIELGRIVISKAGRDKMRPFVVVELVDDDFVKIADGDLRKIDRAKLKKIKHLNVSKSVNPELKKLLESGDGLSDAQLRKAIASFTFGSRERA